MASKSRVKLGKEEESDGHGSNSNRIFDDPCVPLRPIKSDGPCVIHADTTFLQTYSFGSLNSTVHVSLMQTYPFGPLNPTTHVSLM